MEQLKELKGPLTPLPRGGFLVDTPAGYIQFGSPPETIKDTMALPKDVPQVFVLPKKMFNWNKGISVAECEFPIYYNFFLQKRKTLIICDAEQKDKMLKILQESIFGPEDMHIIDDFDPECVGCNIPDLKNEFEFFRNNLTFDQIVDYGIFEDNKYNYNGILIEKGDDGNFSVSQNGELIAEVPGLIEYKATYKIGEKLQEPYIPPLFSITCLGPSHGFDPGENTSGYIIWLNHQGIMVDPPVNSTEWLEDSNVNPKLIDSIILTHCHADHDCGTFQKILEEEKITVYSTETIMMSFLRKYSALSGVSIEYLMKLFKFHPIKIGRPVFIHNGMFNMYYTLHSIPTFGFLMKFQDQTFVYSSDHNNDPSVHEKLFQEGRISKDRYDELRSFPWDSKVIYHESGIAPLHTPIDILNSLDKDIQKRTVVYHIAKSAFPKKTHLTLATFGIENTLTFKTSSPEYEKAQIIIGLLRHLDFFNNLPLEKAQEFLGIVEEVKYKKGELIVKKGTKGDKFYIIYSGNVSVDSGNLEEKKIYSTYEYFGEVALVTDQERQADVYAETDVFLYTIERDKFLNFIVNTDFEKTLLRLAKTRTSETWNLLSTSKTFHVCTSFQKTFLESIFISEQKEGEGFLIREGDKLDYIYIIRDGELEVSKGDKHVTVLKRGDIVGEPKTVYNDEPANYSFFYRDKLSLYAMKAEDIKIFAENNPGLLMKMVYDFKA